VFGCLKRLPEMFSASIRAVLAAVLLSGCAATHTERAPLPVRNESPESGVSVLLRYAERIRTLPEADLRRELDELLASRSSEPDAEETIRYALLLVAGNARFADPAEAARALEDLISRNVRAEDEYIAFAVALLDFLRAGSAVPPVTVRAPLASTNTSNRGAAGRGDDELERVRSELVNERARRIELERQLAELRSLEEALSDRAGFEDEPDND